MIAALRNAVTEGNAAARMAEDLPSAHRLRADFIMSRALRYIRLPGYNAPRKVMMRGGITVNYRLNRGDIQSLREVLMEEVYRCDLPATPTTLLDLGANIGLASLWFSQIRPGQNSRPRTIAVEPVPGNAAVARLNFESNRLDGEVIESAVGRADLQGWFAQRAESNLGHLVQPGAEDDPPKKISVQVFGINTLLDRFPSGTADLVKMDIEGGEAALLGDDTTWLARVRMLLVEWHDGLADSAPLIRNAESAGFEHRRINVTRQSNLSLLFKPA